MEKNKDLIFADQEEDDGGEIHYHNQIRNDPGPINNNNKPPLNKVDKLKEYMIRKNHELKLKKSSESESGSVDRIQSDDGNGNQDYDDDYDDQLEKGYRKKGRKEKKEANVRSRREENRKLKIENFREQIKHKFRHTYYNFYN